MAKQTINVAVLADTRQFSRAMASLGKETGLTRLTAGARTLGSALATAVKTGAAVGGAAVITLGKQAIDAAGDLEQSSGAIETVFGRHAGQMQAWAAQAHTAVGLTANEFNELGTLIGTQLKNGGTAIDQLAPKTNNLIRLGADLSSMYGGTTREAVEALSSALKGERDPIERYGVTLNQTAIDAQAAAMGFHKVGGSYAATAQQAATLALITKQTKDAHGNFARETDTLQHKQQVLKASLGDVAAQLGTRLLPAATAVTGWIGDRIPAATRLASTAIDKIGPAARTAADAIRVVIAGFSGRVPSIDLGPWTSVLATTGQGIRAAWDTITAAMTKVGPTLTTIGSTATNTLTTIQGALSGTIIPSLTTAAGWIDRHRVLVITLTSPVLTLITAAKTYQVTMTAVHAAQAAWNTVTGVAKTLQAAYAFGTYGQITANQGLLATQASLLGVMRQWIISLGRAVVAGARVVASVVAQAAVWTAQKAAMLGHLVVQGAVRAGQLAMAAAQWALNAAMAANPIVLATIALAALAAALIYAYRHSAAFRAAVAAAFTAVSAVAHTMGAAITGALHAIGSGLTAAAAAVTRWATGIASQFAAAWTKARTATTTGVLTVTRFISSLPARAVAAMASLGSRLWSTITGAWSRGTSATTSGMARISSLIRSLPGRVVAAAAGIAGSVRSIGLNIISGIVGGITSAAGTLVSAARGAVSSAITAAKNLLGIHSPSRVFRDIGRYTVDGMVIGLSDRTHALTTQATQLARTVADNATPDPIDITTVTRQQQASTQAQPITINIQTLNWDRRVQDQLIAALRDAHRRGLKVA
ncbi:phage tail protein [Acidipropionibacterium timonense]|uniref:phage tail protein n=1 Tax=Acidipropionibacterium timonense TaxID=2161818 RepID=UPI0010322357|nr:hypothetical protein [Acidipropionibacterium timonense]